MQGNCNEMKGNASLLSSCTTLYLYRVLQNFAKNETTPLELIDLNPFATLGFIIP